MKQQERIEKASIEYANILPQGRISKKYSAIDFTAGAKWALSSQWISVDDDLPPHDDKEKEFSINVMFRKGGKVEYGYYNFIKRNWRSYSGYSIEDVTHWMFIPPLEGGKE